MEFMMVWLQAKQETVVQFYWHHKTLIKHVDQYGAISVFHYLEK